MQELERIHLRCQNAVSCTQVSLGIIADCAHHGHQHRDRLKYRNLSACLTAVKV